MIPSQKLTEWVKSKHQGQFIKQTTEPYFNHVLAVAELAKPVVALGYEIGLCHDLLEDTVTTAGGLVEALLGFGYTVQEANRITSYVVELTDVFTAAAFPGITKSRRKEMEATRLVKISPAAQSVKYGDLLYNINWVLKFDQQHAKKYLKKKRLLLADLNKGDWQLRQQVLDIIETWI